MIDLLKPSVSYVQCLVFGVQSKKGDDTIEGKRVVWDKTEFAILEAGRNGMLRPSLVEGMTSQAGEKFVDFEFPRFMELGYVVEAKAGKNAGKRDSQRTVVEVKDLGIASVQLVPNTAGVAKSKKAA